MRYQNSHWLIISAFIMLAVVFGYLGWLYHFISAICPQQPTTLAEGAVHILSCLSDGYFQNQLRWPDHYLAALANTLSLFAAELAGEKVQQTNYVLQLGRLFALCATLGAVLKIMIMLLRKRWDVFWTRRLKNHTIICGNTATALNFAKNESHYTSKLLLIDSDLDESIINLSGIYGFRILRGDPSDSGVLTSAAIHHATRLIVATAHDGINLEIAMTAKNIIDQQAKTKLKAYVAIEDRMLWRQLSSSAAIDRNSDYLEFLPFNLALWAARDVLAQHFFPRLADIRDQQKMHFVFVGLNSYSEALIGQLPPSLIYKKATQMRLSIFSVGNVADDKARLEALYPTLASSHFLEIVYKSFDPEKRYLDQDAMAQLIRDESNCEVPVTAIFVCRDGGAKALGTAITLKDAMNRTRQWNAPIFVQLAQCGKLSKLLKDTKVARHFHEVIEPFGMDDILCDLKFLENIEEIAKSIHFSYLKSQATDKKIEIASKDKEWIKLDETYRISNRRAADHIMTKFFAAGAYISAHNHHLSAHKAFIQLFERADITEYLARLEHDSWHLGRIIDGWTYGSQRDNDAKIHDMMRPYDDLPKGEKDKDQDQINLIEKKLLKPVSEGGATALRTDIRIGLIGKNKINLQEADYLKTQLLDIFGDDILKYKRDSHFTIMTPLAPGSDLIMTEALTGYLRQNNISYKLLIIEAVPETFMLDDFKDFCEVDSCWDGKHIISDNFWEDKNQQPGIMSQILQKRKQIISDRCTDWIIDLTVGNQDWHVPEKRQSGYGKAADYLVRHSDILYASNRFETDEIAKIGGISATLQARKKMEKNYENPSNRPRILKPKTVEINLDLSSNQ